MFSYGYAGAGFLLDSFWGTEVRGYNLSVKTRMLGRNENKVHFGMFNVSKRQCWPKHQRGYPYDR